MHAATSGVTGPLGGSGPVALQRWRPPQSASAISLKQDMRKLWTGHVVWTRDYIIAAVGDPPDAKAAANRLMKNQVVARLNKDCDADVRAFDEVYEHIVHMADALSDGIVKQFPDKFA